MICAILQQKGYSPEDVNEVIIASVVPKIMYSFTSGIIKYLHCHPLVVGAGIKTGIRIETANPKEIGPDRIVDAVSAYEQYGGPIIVVDFGTATTYDIVTAEGAFLGWCDQSRNTHFCERACGIIQRICRKLRSNARGFLLQRIRSHQCRQDCFLARSVSRSTLFERSKKSQASWMRKLSQPEDLGKIISEHTDEIQVYDSDLTLRGLQIIYDKQKK